jgi:hypothetical protein
MRGKIVLLVARLLGVEIGIYDWSKTPPSIWDYDRPKR